MVGTSGGYQWWVPVVGTMFLNMIRLQLSSSQSLCKQMLMAEGLADIANTLAKDETEPNLNE